MRILVLGGAGMLGHKLLQGWSKEEELWTTLRRGRADYPGFGSIASGRLVEGIDVTNGEALLSVFRKARPEAVVNCVGVIKQKEEAKHALTSIGINSLFPHRLAEICALAGARLVHISTDCVFSGNRGKYKETDLSDAEDLYGRTKFLGELHDQHCVTLRTSIIGRELGTRSGLIEWFLSQEGQQIRGYRRAIYTGFTTLELSRIILDVLRRRTDISGLWQVSSDPITKFDLLMSARQPLGWNGEIVPFDDFHCDRSLDSTRFREATGYRPPSWDAMLAEMAADVI